MIKQPYGLNDLMLTAAHRYCLGRSSYIVSEFVTWFIDHYDNFDNNAIVCVHKETIEHLNQTVDSCYVHECDRAQWEYLVKFLDEKRGLYV
jgi:hypothetical protein